MGLVAMELVITFIALVVGVICFAIIGVGGKVGLSDKQRRNFEQSLNLNKDNHSRHPAPK